ncbi:asparaginase [Paramicrobacterium fandaimingii]|uniref:asparaginase n=1 Tax=Paramicrobacterium fandaimingii TaxID=2708079 RepID=UPI00141EB7E5|nr:asparaginase [Microbacterium fandaimingii]
MAQLGTFTAEEARELAILTRSGFVESRHVGSAVVLDQHGDIQRSIGAPDKPIFPRSSLKPFQAIAVLNAGVQLRGAQAVLATASHTGTMKHMSTVRAMLATAGLTEDALQCPPALPQDESTRNTMIQQGVGPQRIAMNCSGKHAAMLLACAANGWDTEGYLHPEHPMQRAVLDTVERFTGEKPAATATDGCGAPVFAVSLVGLARGIARVRTSSPSSPFAIYRNAGVLAEAVLEDPWAIQGPGTPNTIVIERLGVFAKLGAEGVMVMAARDGTTAALKMLDGSGRAAMIVALELLVRAGSLSRSDVDAVIPDLDLSVLGGEAVVGHIEVSPTL